MGAVEKDEAGNNCRDTNGRTDTGGTGGKLRPVTERVLPRSTGNERVDGRTYPTPDPGTHGSGFGVRPSFVGTSGLRAEGPRKGGTWETDRGSRFHKGFLGHRYPDFEDLRGLTLRPPPLTRKTHRLRSQTPGPCLKTRCTIRSSCPKTLKHTRSRPHHPDSLTQGHSREHPIMSFSGQPGVPKTLGGIRDKVLEYLSTPSSGTSERVGSRSFMKHGWRSRTFLPSTHDFGEQSTSVRDG